MIAIVSALKRRSFGIDPMVLILVAFELLRRKLYVLGKRHGALCSLVSMRGSFLFHVNKWMLAGGVEEATITP